MSQPRIVFIAKTDINTDGRVLNELKILQSSNPGWAIHLILLPDKKITIELGSNVVLHEISTRFRNISALRVLTVLEFIFKSLYLLLKLKPHILHVQDSSVILPSIIYKCFRGRKTKYIYDDHEMPNEKEGLSLKLNNYFENLFMTQADWVIFANKERMELLCERHSLNLNKTSFFLNLQYFSENNDILDEVSELKFLEIKNLKERGLKLILHQGVITEERGAAKLAQFSELLPPEYKIMLLGGSVSGFKDFLTKFSADPGKFHFVGPVNYNLLQKFWQIASASIIMYLPTFINNRLCAPNRFYIAVEQKIPIFINKDNPVLRNFITTYRCGYYIEDMTCDMISKSVESKLPSIDFEQLKISQKKEITDLYTRMLNYAY